MLFVGHFKSKLNALIISIIAYSDWEVDQKLIIITFNMHLSPF